MDLKFKSKEVRNFEQKHGSIMEKMEPTIDNIKELIRLGSGNCTEDRAYEILDSELEKDGKDLIEILFDIFGVLQRYGFFPQKANLRKLKEKFTDSIENAFQTIDQKVEQKLETVQKDIEKEEQEVELEIVTETEIEKGKEL